MSTCGDTKFNLRRSALYMPSSNARALEKAKTIDADVFIFDLEDAVAPDAKVIARDRAIQVANEHREKMTYGRSEVVIRVNGIGTPWFLDDVKAVSESGADAILLPKTSRAQDVNTLQAHMSSSSDLAIWCMIETPLGVFNALEIAASEKVSCLCMGTVDLSNDLRCNPNVDKRWNLQFALQTCVAAARACDKTVLDSVYIDLANDAGYLRECEQGRDLGFDGKTIIHPKMVHGANEAFSPSAAEISHAQKTIDEHRRALDCGSGVVVVNGKLVEELHVRSARRLLSIADAIGSC